MTQRMGRKLSELAVRLETDSRLEEWWAAVRDERTPGCWPVAQGLLFAVCGLDAESLFAAHQYGAANMIVSAALRCIRVSHYDTQAILRRLGALTGELFDEVRELTLDEMHLFAPEAEILAALHERGAMRMFMN